jgi:hypothetical protein
VSVYERLEALNIGRCGINASQPRNFSIGVCYLKSVCGRRIGRLLDTLRMLELPQSGLDITLTIRMGDTRRAPNFNWGSPQFGANLGPKLGPFRPQSGVLGRQRQQTQQDFW